MGSKAETAKMVMDTLTPNTKLVRQARKELKNKGIKSPDVKKLPYWIRDNRLSSTYYFPTEQRLQNCIERLTEDRPLADFIISHPDLICKTSISNTATSPLSSATTKKK